MQEIIVSEEIAKLDLTKVAALQQKRTLAFVNHFAITTVQFLNGFLRQCEQKLMHFERKLEKVEATMVLLEARLSSIPEVNTLQVETKPENTTIQSEDRTDDKQSENVDTERVNDQTLQKDVQTLPKEVKIQPEYERFVKMVQVGVPLQAVKLKVSLEGLDPSILEQILNK